MTELFRQLQARPPARRTLAGLCEAKVTRTTADGVYVAADVLPDVELGPCRWQTPATVPAVSGPDAPHTHGPGAPPAGTRCLVVQATGVTSGSGLWVLAFDRWPA